MLSLIGVSILCLFTGLGCTHLLEVERDEDRCDTIMKEIASEDRATVTDDTPARLHSTWLSEECEIRAGPEYIVRKYSFFANGTFLLLRFYYAEESCSIATYTVVARGSIEITSASVTVPGATEADVRLDSIRLVPFNRQVVHKFERRLNASCGGIETKWRMFTAQLIYERREIDGSSNASFQDHGLNSNSFQSRLPRPRNRGSLECLEYLGIEFTELGLLRVEKRRFDSVDADGTRTKVELLLGEVGRNGRSVKQGVGARRPNRFQSAALLRADTTFGCLTCGSVLRGSEYNPPLFHQAPSLPAVIDGIWLSIRCESVDEGFWSRRFFRIYSGGNRWSARWTYYTDSACSIPLHTVIVAGTYVQRAVRRKRDDDHSSITIDREGARLWRTRRPLIPESSGPSITSRGTWREKPDVVRTESVSFRKDTALLSGTTELELRVIESRSVPVDKTVWTRCSTAAKRTATGSSWSKNCVPRTVEAPAVLTFKARIGLDWNEEYILLLAPWKDELWEAPLRRCSGTISQRYFRANSDLPESLQGRQFQTETHNQLLKRQGRYWFPSSTTSCLSTSSSLVYLAIVHLLPKLHHA
ncbi:protein APCDD1-like isoform X1 [Hylaeus anthracinus]|uniref:protein APCDD1-like isoform X1 n=2 Tax=Hylaeus anthracinus TaxID=313031 RepID=UPI0023B8A700|nr:protein APCDD1-like isoform X1 [Hylaeus anthracinus]